MEKNMENETSALINEVKRICHILARKEVETLFLSFDMKDKKSQYSGSSVGITFIQHLVIIEKFQKFCEDAYSTRIICDPCTEEKEKYTDFEQAEEFNGDISDKDDSGDSSDSLKLEIDESDIESKDDTCSKQDKKRTEQTHKNLDIDIKTRFPITPRITRSVSRMQEKCLRSNTRFRSSGPLKLPLAKPKLDNSVAKRKVNAIKMKEEDCDKMEKKLIKRESYREKKQMGQKNKMDSEHKKYIENKMDVSVNELKCKIKKEYVCKICKEGFTKLIHFQDHVRSTKHLQEQNIKCNVCGEYFVNMRSLGQHRNIMKHFLKCDICGKIFTRMKAYGIHVRLHKREHRNIEKKHADDKKEIKFSCDICNAGFSTTKGLGQHRYRYKHYHKCKDCGKMFSRKKIFGIHCRKHENKPRKWKKKKSHPTQHQCNICGKIFGKSYPLRIHIRYHTGEKPYMCDKCGKVTASKTELNMHKLIHTDERPYSCHICNKSFRMLNKLKRHQIVHTGLKPHKCTECGKCFTTASNMRIHVKNIHMGIKRFSCEICDIKFAHSSNMRAHMKGVHKKRELNATDNKKEDFELLEAKEIDTYQNNPVKTLQKRTAVDNGFTSINRNQSNRSHKKETLESIQEKKNYRNIFNDFNSKSGTVIQFLPKSSMTHAESNFGVTTSKQNRITNDDQNNSVTEKSTENDPKSTNGTQTKNENVNEVADRPLFIDEFSVAGQIPLIVEPQIRLISNQSEIEMPTQDGMKLQTQCIESNRRDLQAQDDSRLLEIKSKDFEAEQSIKSQVQNPESNGKDLQTKDSICLQKGVLENIGNKLQAHQVEVKEIVIQSLNEGLDRIQTNIEKTKGEKNELETGGEVINVIEFKAQILDSTEVQLQPEEQTVSDIELESRVQIVQTSDLQVQAEVTEEVELQIQEQVLGESVFHSSEQVIEGVELQEQEQLIIDGAEVIDRSELQTNKGMIKRVQVQGTEHIIEEIELQTQEQTVDSIELQNQEQLIGAIELQAQEQTCTVSGFELQTQEQTVGGFELQTQEQTVGGVELQTQDELVNGVSLQGQTMGSLQDQDGTIIELNHDSEIHVVYQPEYGEIRDNIPHLIYLYPAK